MYLLFKSQRLCNLYVFISKLVNECTVKYFSFDRFLTEGLVAGRKLFLVIRARVFRVFIVLLEIIDSYGEVLRTRIHFSDVEASNEKDDLFTGI